MNSINLSRATTFAAYSQNRFLIYILHEAITSMIYLFFTL